MGKISINHDSHYETTRLTVSYIFGIKWNSVLNNYYVTRERFFIQRGNYLFHFKVKSCILSVTKPFSWFHHIILKIVSFFMLQSMWCEWPLNTILYSWFNNPATTKRKLIWKHWNSINVQHFYYSISCVRSQKSKRQNGTFFYLLLDSMSAENFLCFFRFLVHLFLMFLNWNFK